MAAAEPGDPTSEDTEIGPLSSATAAERLQDQLERAVAQGAEVVVGGEREGNFFEPTCSPGSSRDDDASQEEFFGPVAQRLPGRLRGRGGRARQRDPVRPRLLRDDDDPEQAERVADRIEAGMVFVNVVGADGAELPFGGFKRSGFGRELGRYGADEFVNKKLIRSA